MNWKKIAVVVLIIITALTANYLIAWKRRKDEEDYYFNKLLDAFNQYADSSALHWLLPGMNEYMNGIRQIDPAYLIDGKITKPGAFMAVYASSYDGSGAFVNGDPKEVLDKMYSIFYEAKQKRQLENLS